MLLTGTRADDVRQARWDQFDLDHGLWRKPNPGSVHKQPRRIRLSGPVLALLTELAETSTAATWLFPSNKCDGPVNDIDDLWDEVTRAAGVEDANLTRLRPTLASNLFANQEAPVMRRLLGLPDRQAQP